MKYWTYILETEKGTLYTGVAIDVEKRFQEHLDGSSKGKKGAKYTNSNKPVKIVYKKQFDSKSLANETEPLQVPLFSLSGSLDETPGRDGGAAVVVCARLRCQGWPS